MLAKLDVQEEKRVETVNSAVAARTDEIVTEVVEALYSAVF